MNNMNQFKQLVFVFFLLLSNNSLAQKSETELENKSSFDLFSGPPLTGKYGQVSALKIVYSIQNDQLYFINAKQFKYHHEYCAARLGANDDFKAFNELNYSNSAERKFLLANINYYSSLHKYALEISPADMMDTKSIVVLYQKVVQRTFLDEQLHVLINTARLTEKKNELQGYFPVLEAAEIYGSLSYQAISKHENKGRLRFIENLKKEKEQIQSSDIIVINETPLILPEVAGIIVTEFQTPLSHLSILGQNRKIPIMAYKNAFEIPELRKLMDGFVALQVENDTFYIEKLAKIKPEKKRRKKVKLYFDLKTNTLIDMADAGKRSHKYAGNKAGNFAILQNLSEKHDFKVPEGGFVIPFSYYYNHVAPLGIDSLLAYVEKDSIPGDSIKVALKRMRKKIMRQELDSLLLVDVQNKLSRYPEFKRFRFRSSTNAEDAKGFSGAGLYASKTGQVDSPESIEKAIKKVWSSLWSYKAFQERKYFNIDHSRVYMGVLVHRSFPEEHVNGVAITKNIYRKNYPGFVVNAQLGDESVVEPDPGVICDQFICYTSLDDNVYTTANTIDIISVSNLNDHQMVMTQKEVQQLANQLEHIKRSMVRVQRGTEQYFDQGLDIEFKLDGPDRDLYIKQVRVYND
ncbi:PEP/pyruvate-binding domain-containing protein [Lutimonas sp.]|uniref:PEP/pyruvate-binding domain-containing protein n=1 Tax=Lutimonas sp. TaxID=1872403 RepID=UPI003D9B1CAF